MPPRPPEQIAGRLAEPALVIDLSNGDAPAQADEAPARAIVLHHKAAIVPVGTLIPAVLETPIDSSRPGPVRAITSSDTRSFDGSRVLIPKGSRLIGDFHADAQGGQTRVLVTWIRLVRPDGVSLRLAAPAAAPNGGTGIPGAVNNHLAARMTSVVLQSALSVGVDLASRPGNGSVIIGSPAQAAGAAGQSLIPTADQKPTITVKEGANITAFITHDLDFSGALPRQ